MAEVQLRRRTNEAALEAEVPKEKASSVRHLFVFCSRRELAGFLLATLLSAALAGAKTAYALILGEFFDIISRFGSGAASPDDTMAQVSVWCLALAGLGVLKAVLASVFMGLWIRNGEVRARTVRLRLFQSLLRKEMAWFDTRRDGLASLMTEQYTHIREIQAAMAQILGHVVSDVFLCVACLIVAFQRSWELTLALLASVPVSLFVLSLLGRNLEAATEAQRRELNHASKYATASLLAIDLVKVYNGHDDELWKYLGRVRCAAGHYLSQARGACSQMGYVKFWMVCLFVVGFWFGVFLADKGRATPGGVLTAFYAVLIAFQSVESLGTQWLTLVKGMTAGKALQAVVGDKEMQGCGARERKGGLLRPAKAPQDIELVDVSFSYPSNPSKMVLHPSRFFFPTGEMSFIVGRSGSGKSTIADLLVGFYAPNSGQILVDGVPSSDLDISWLRENVTLIQQSSTLFSGSIGMNVALGGRDPEHVTADEIKAACQTALLQSTLSNLPAGLDTVVGPRSDHALSGGQKQRLALARARLRDPAVLILDETTSGLDPLSAAMVMEAVRAWRRGKTTIVITHDVFQIGNDDFVYVVDQGSVVQEGYFKTIAHAEEGPLHSMLEATGSALSSPIGGKSSDDGDEPQGAAERDIADERSTMEKWLSLRLDGQTAGTGLFKHMSLRAPVNHGPSAAPPAAAGHSRCRSSLEIVNDMGQDAQVKRRRSSVYPYPAGGGRRPTRASITTTATHEKGSNEDTPSQLENGGTAQDNPDGRTPSLPKILATVWLKLDAGERVHAALGALACAVVAAGNPAFSYVFAQMLQAFWAPAGAREAAGRTWAVTLLGIACVDGVAVFLAFYLAEQTAQAWIDALRVEALKRVLRQPKSWWVSSSASAAAGGCDADDNSNKSDNNNNNNNNKHGRVVECLDRHAEEARKLVSVFVPILAIAAGMVIASVVWALFASWRLTLVALAAAPAVAGAARWASRVSDAWEARCNAAAEAASAVASEVFPNVRVVRALTLEALFARRFERAAAEAFATGLRRARWTGLLYGPNQGVSDWLTALVFFYGVRLLTSPSPSGTGGQEEEISVGAVIQVVNLLLFSIGTATAMLGNIPQISASKAVAAELLRYASLPLDAGHEHRVGASRARSLFPVEMRGLRFRYPGRPSDVLRNVNLTIHQGDFLAIVGASGSGKTTIVSVLLRLYEVLGPEVEADDQDKDNHHHHHHNGAPLTFAGVPAHALDTAALRHQMAYVPQQPALFPGSVRDNIAYGLREDSPLRGRAFVEDAARAAGIHDFVASLPEGYDTLVGDGAAGGGGGGDGEGRGGGGEGMAALSGGQAQRLCIARALVRRPRLLVMDEPTSALDAEAAARVRDTLRHVSSMALPSSSFPSSFEGGSSAIDNTRANGNDNRGGRGRGEGEERMAVVVVTHSREMMRAARRVALVEDGCVVACGPYERLVAEDGRFAQLVGEAYR